MNEVEWQNDDPFEVSGDTLVLSKRMVLKSAAGFYIGYLCKTIKCSTKNEEKGDKPGLIEPFDRFSGYYPTRKKAEQALIQGY